MGYGIVSYYFICFLFSIIFVLIAFFQLPSRISQLFQLLTISNFLVNFGHALIIAVPSATMAWAGIPVVITGGSFIGLCYLSMCYSIVHRDIKRWALALMLAGNVFFVVASFFDYKRHFFFSNPGFEIIGVANVKIMATTWGYHLYTCWNAMYVVLMAIVVFKAYKAGGDKRYRQKGLRSLVNAGIIALVFFVLSVFLKINIDLTPMGLTLAGIYLCISIRLHKLYEISEDLGHTVLDSLSDIVIAYDVNKNFQYANEFTKRCFPELNAFPYNVSLEYISQNIDDVMVLKNNDIYKRNDQEYLCHVLPIKNRGHLTGYVRWLHDETIERRHIQEVTSLKDEAERANSAKSRFLAHVTHEIRTPINAVIGMDELIIRETKESFTHNYAQQSMRAGKTLLALVNDILDSSKIEAGKMEIVPAEYNPYQMLDDIMIMTKFRADEKGLYLSSHIDENLPETLFGDETRVKQIITNIVTNAVKYTNRGSVSVSITCNRLGTRKMELVAKVIDTGIGIKKEDLPKLYGSFERIENDTTHKTEGTGLGMSISTKLLELMGGSMEIESEYGKGSCFTITIPQEIPVDDSSFRKMLSPGEVSSPNRTVSESEPLCAPDARILIVDDTQTNTFLAKALLKHTQITVDTASSGHECLDLASKNHYDIIFIDYRMPEMDGIETVEKLRADNLAPDTPLVMMTAESETGARDFFLSHGLTDYIAKPLDPKAYEALIRKLIK